MEGGGPGLSQGNVVLFSNHANCTGSRTDLFIRPRVSYWRSGSSGNLGIRTEKSPWCPKSYLSQNALTLNCDA